jgi:hypothetical protein
VATFGLVVAVLIILITYTYNNFVYLFSLVIQRRNLVIRRSGRETLLTSQPFLITRRVIRTVAVLLLAVLVLALIGRGAGVEP